MDTMLFKEANGIYFHIQKIEEQKKQLWILKDQMIDVLKKGFPRIPAEDLLDLSKKIDTLIKYLDEDIDKRWKRINKL